MNREIKFRAWHKGFQSDMGGRNVEPHMMYEERAGDVFRWDYPDGRIEIMQSTGLKDKNGKEIYEGDLIKLFRHDDIQHKHIEAKTWQNGEYRIDIKQVKFVMGSFVIWSDLIKDYRCFAHLARPGESFEVIGNIYENAELLNS